MKFKYLDQVKVNESDDFYSGSQGTVIDLDGHEAFLVQLHMTQQWFHQNDLELQ